MEVWLALLSPLQSPSVSKRLLQITRALSRALSSLAHAGRCNICGYRGLFHVRPEAWDNLRETLDCPRCRSISRDRFLAAVIAVCLDKPPIMAEWPVDKSVVIREPSAFRGGALMLARKVNYRPLKFPEENLEALKDADNSINHLVTADVFEHVRFDDLAFREVYRVLRPGGFFFLQVPYDHSERTRILVQSDGERGHSRSNRTKWRRSSASGAAFRQTIMSMEMMPQRLKACLT
jgi:SAM-dependent methyltransferase